MIDYEKVNHELLFVLGASMQIIAEYKPCTPREQQLKMWILDAIENGCL